MEDGFLSDIHSGEGTYRWRAYDMELFDWCGGYAPDWGIRRVARLREVQRFQSILDDLQLEEDQESEDETRNQLELLDYLNLEGDLIEDFEDAGTCLKGCDKHLTYILKGFCDGCEHEEMMEYESKTIDAEIRNMMAKRDLMSKYGTVEGAYRYHMLEQGYGSDDDD